MAGRLSGLALAEIGGGLVLAWSGMENVPVAETLRSLAAGRLPPPGPGETPASPPGPGGGPSGGSSALASDMQGYVGRVPYVWAGASPSGWDCSGAVNYCACHDVKLAIPGYAAGEFTGAVHGPSTLGWLAWAPAHLARLSRSQVQAGDLVIWQSHMGVATSATLYVSAYDSADGTCVKPIHGGGPLGEVATYWRYP